VHGQQDTQLIEGLLLASSLGAFHVREQLADAPLLLQQNGDDVAVRLLDGHRYALCGAATPFPAWREKTRRPAGRRLSRLVTGGR
jgi:hypothetical protein